IVKLAPDNVRYLRQCREHILGPSFTARDPFRKSRSTSTCVNAIGLSLPFLLRVSPNGRLPCFAPTRRPRLFVEPGVLHAPVVDDAVGHHCPTLDLRLPAIGKTIVKDDWPRAFLGQLPFNLPYQLLALSLVSLH